MNDINLSAVNQRIAELERAIEQNYQQPPEDQDNLLDEAEELRELKALVRRRRPS